jgi:hypothetical protein
MKMRAVPLTIALLLPGWAGAQESASINTSLSKDVYQVGAHQPDTAVPKPDGNTRQRIIIDRTDLTDPAIRLEVRLFYTMDGVTSVGVGAAGLAGGIVLRNGEPVTATSFSVSPSTPIPDGASLFTTLTVRPDTPPANTGVIIQFLEGD